MKEKLISSIIKGEKYENDELNKKVDKVEECEEAVPIVKAYVEIIQMKKNSKICVASRQGLIFKNFKQKQNFTRIMKDFSS